MPTIQKCVSHLGDHTLITYSNSLTNLMFERGINSQGYIMQLVFIGLKCVKLLSLEMHLFLRKLCVLNVVMCFVATLYI